jgi:hypothetical protein
LRAFIDAEETMTLKADTHRTTLISFLLLAFLSCLFLNPVSALALGDSGASLPSFAEFTKTVQNREANVLRGVYVPEILALPVTQQPADNAGYVANKTGEATQFGMAAKFGNVGLLAHNHLSGSLFTQLAIGQEVRLVYGNGAVEYFVISEIMQYQALQPTSLYSSFRDLNTNEMLTAEEVFNKVYRGERHVTFQTCIASAESLSWGRLFIIAVPKTQMTSMELFDLKLNR